MNFDQLLEPMGIHLFHCAHGGDRIEFYNVVWMFLHPLQELLDFMFCKNIHILSSSPLHFFLLMGWHCFIDWQHLHISWCHHCRLHLNRLGITSNFFSQGGYISNGLSEERIFLWLLLNRCVSPFCHRRFFMFSSTNSQLSSSMC